MMDIKNSSCGMLARQELYPQMNVKLYRLRFAPSRVAGAFSFAGVDDFINALFQNHILFKR